MERITIIGHVGRDAEVRNHNGQQFATLSVAVSKRIKNGEEEREITNWYDVVTDNIKLAPYLLKGTKVYVEGYPRAEVYYSEKHGKHLPKIAISKSRFELLSSKKEEAPAEAEEPEIPEF